MGWLYTSSAERMAEYFPRDTIAWIVPNTPVIDAANTDIDAFSRHFYCRYWLYSTVSKDAEFPVPKIDYFEPYVREAVKRKHGLMPQSAFCANTLNLQYLADAGWNGLADAATYSRQFARDYFAGLDGASRGLDLYTQVTTRYRDWVNNLQTRPVKIKPEEFEMLQAAERAFRDAYQAAPTPLVRDRIRDYAISAVRAFKRYPRLRPPGRLKALTATQSLCGVRPIDPEHDFFGRILQEEMLDATQATTRPAFRPARPSAQTGAAPR